MMVATTVVVYISFFGTELPSDPLCVAILVVVLKSLAVAVSDFIVSRVFEISVVDTVLIVALLLSALFVEPVTVAGTETVTALDGIVVVKVVTTMVVVGSIVLTAIVEAGISVPLIVVTGIVD